jgi:multicomponent Na+:H+ antiporter subunit E
MPIKPTMVTFKVDLPSSHAKVILGNSITLTPGTLTVDIEDDTFTIHALDSNSYAGIEDDSMPRQVLSLFSSEDRPVVRDFKILNPES